MIENQRSELESKVTHYAEINRKQREEASAAKSEFEKEIVDLQEQLAEKEDEMRRAQINFDAQIKAREARLVETAKKFDEEKQKMIEEHQSNIEELQASIQELQAERERKIRQHREEIKEWESKYIIFPRKIAYRVPRYKTSVEGYEERLEENEKRHISHSEELEAIIRKKEVPPRMKPIDKVHV